MSTTNTWASASLSTLSTLERWESEINGLSDSDSNWNGKIDAAKELIGNQLEWFLKMQGYSVNEEEGEVLLDIIANPETFNDASDFYTLYRIYRDVDTGGAESLYTYKANQYYKDFDTEFALAKERINYDTNLDGDVNSYSPMVRTYTLVR